MSHDHHDHRSLGITSLNKAFVIGIVLNAGFVVAEFIAGFWYNSLGLISDAGHNLGDVFSLVLAMLAFRLAKVSPTLRYTYGYKKSTILVSLLNAVILLVAVGFILGESIDKLFHPPVMSYIHNFVSLLSLTNPNESNKRVVIWYLFYLTISCIRIIIIFLYIVIKPQYIRFCLLM